MFKPEPVINECCIVMQPGIIVTQFLRDFWIQGIIHSWWVILFIILCYMAFENGIKTTQEQYLALESQLRVLQATKSQLEIIQENLLLQINSQSDPAWIELVLMRVLGLVPEGYKKVYFIDSYDN